jgi:hypothetical protein
VLSEPPSSVEHAANGRGGTKAIPECTPFVFVRVHLWFTSSDGSRDYGIEYVIILRGVFLERIPQRPPLNREAGKCGKAHCSLLSAPSAKFAVEHQENSETPSSVGHAA